MEEEGVFCAGIHYIDLNGFYETFFFNPHRKSFKYELEKLIRFARETNAQHFFVGGSFVTYKRHPKDLDCLIVYSKQSDIPSSKINILNGLDVQYASTDFPRSVDAYLHLFSHDSTNVEKGIIQIKIDDTEAVWNIDAFKQKDYQEVKNLYRLYSGEKSKRSFNRLN